MAKNRGPESEPRNPDGCVLGKKEAKQLQASVEVLSDAFLAGAQTIRASLTLLSETIFGMALKIEKVSNRFNKVLKKTSSKKTRAEESGQSSVLLPSRKEVEQLVGSIQIEQPKLAQASAFKLIKPAMVNLINVTESIGRVLGDSGIETPSHKLIDAANKRTILTKPRIENQTNRRLSTLASMGTRPGSMYTHDIHCERILGQIVSLLAAANTGQRKVASKPKVDKKKAVLDKQIDELRSKFPRLTKLFIDAPAKMKEEFKYWSGIMSKGWNLASNAIKTGAKATYKALTPKEKFPKALDKTLEGLGSLEKSGPNKKPQSFKGKKGAFAGPIQDSLEDAAAAFLADPDIYKLASDKKKPSTKGQKNNRGKMISSSPHEGAYPLREEGHSDESFKYPSPKAPFENAIPLTIFDSLGKALELAIGSLKKLAKASEPKQAGLDPEKERRKARFEKNASRKRLQHRAGGGSIFPSKGDAKGTDTVPAMLTPGEFVVNKKAAQKNRGSLERMNSGTKYLASGGSVGGGSGGGGKVADMSGFMQGISGAGKALGAIGMVGKMAVGAITGTIGAFSRITGFVGPFVEAFNPALMEQMNLVFKDLMAVVGMGLEPIIGAVIPIVRAFADSLVPVMQAMIPTVQLVADSMIELAGPIIGILMEAVAALEPIFVMVASSISSFAGVLTWATPMIAAVIKEIVYWFTKVVSSIQWFAGALIKLIPGTGKLGQTMQDNANKSSKATDDYYNGTSKVQKALQKPLKPGASTAAAAGKSTYSGISDLGRNLMQSAMSSSTQASSLETAKNTGKTVEVLDDINAKLGKDLPSPAARQQGVRRGQNAN